MRAETDIDAARAICRSAPDGPWALWTGCSWRRFGTEAGMHREILRPTNSPADGHPDLFIESGTAEFICWARTAVPQMLDEIERLRGQLATGEGS